MTDALSQDPNVRRRRLGIELRRRREAAALNQREAATALEWSLSKVVRIETGAHGVSVIDLKAMLDLYRVTDKAEVDALVDAARGSRGKPWWADYSDVVSPQFARLLGFEGLAAEFRISHPFLIPGLLHTREYAAGLFAAFPETEKTPKLIDLRMKRQEQVFAQPDVSFTFIIGEEALCRHVGGPRVMRQQLERLVEVGASDNISVRIVPFTSGSHPGLMTPFIMLRHRETDDDLLFVESVNGDQLVDDPAIIAGYAEYLEIERELSIDGERAQALLRERIDGLRRDERDAGDGEG
jgi:transcriptional regulator with XRE-family HTH domain